MEREITGIICAMITPHSEDGSLDEDGLNSLIDYLIESGVNAIFPTGSAGEGPMLSREEKEEVISSVIDAVNGRIPVTPGIACTTTAETIELGRACDDMGADALVLVTPWYYRLDDQSILEHFRSVCEGTDSRMIAYRIPQCAVNDISHELLGDLTDLENLYAVKDSSGDVVWLSQAILRYGDRLNFYAGADRMILPSLAAGTVGHVSGSSNCFPEEVVAIYRSFMAGDVEAARAAQQDLLDKVTLFPPGRENSAIREILRAKGIETGEPLRPMGRLDEAEVRAIQDRLG